MQGFYLRGATQRRLALACQYPGPLCRGGHAQAVMKRLVLTQRGANAVTQIAWPLEQTQAGSDFEQDGMCLPHWIENDIGSVLQEIQGNAPKTSVFCSQVAILQNGPGGKAGNGVALHAQAQSLLPGCWRQRVNAILPQCDS